VKDSTKELLSLLLWTSDMLARPTLRNLTDSYETWAYRKGFRRQARLLQRQKLLEIKPPAHAAPAVSERVLQLTEEGRLVALGGRDPGLAWKRDRNSNADDGLRDWIRQEWQAWLAAVSVDPLLPKSLLPSGYLGQEVWKRRWDSSRRTAAALRGKW